MEGIRGLISISGRSAVAPLADIQAAGIMAAGMGEAHMFWKRKPSAEQPVPAKERFEAAKEATRRAVFLSVAQGMTADDDYKRQLSELVLTCRSAAVKSGTSTGHSEVEIDAAIASLCDADVSRMRNATDQEFVAYTQESGEIVKRFLSNK